MTYTVAFERTSGATDTFTYAVSTQYAIQGMKPYAVAELSTPSVYTYCNDPVV